MPSAAQPDTRVRTIRHDSPNFQATLRSLPGQIPQELIQVLPYSIIVENNGSLPIASIVTRVEFVNPEGKPVRHEFHIYHRLDDSKAIINPGQRRFLSPIPAVDHIVNSGGQLPVPILAQAAQLLRRDVALFQKATLDLDSIVFSDGELIGPDKSNIAARFAAWNQAEQDLISSVQSKSKDPAALAIYLNSVANTTELPTTSPLEIDHALRRKKDVAKSLIQQLNSNPTLLPNAVADIQKLKLKSVKRK